MDYQFDQSGKLRALTAEELAEADKDSSIIVENKGVLADGTSYWAYIAVKPSQYDEFMRLTLQEKPVNLHEYGTILSYGFESAVPDAVKAEMKKQYGCDDNYLAILAQDVEQAQIAFIRQQETNRIDDIVAMLKKRPPDSAT